MSNKVLPAIEPAKPQPKRSVVETIAREVQNEKEVKEIRIASGFIDKFLALFSDYSFRTHYNHKRKIAAVSNRSADAICGEVRQFYARRPRPWRPAGSRQRPEHKTRFHYRRALNEDERKGRTK